MATKKVIKDDKRYPAVIDEKPLKKVTKKAGDNKKTPARKNTKKAG